MTTQPDPTIRERLRELAERHKSIPAPGWLRTKQEWCRGCKQPWPCDARILSVHLDTLERRVRAAEKAALELLDAVNDELRFDPDRPEDHGISVEAAETIRSLSEARILTTRG